jgi:hypothetical protein
MSTGFQVRQKLSLVDWPQLLHGLYFHDYGSLDDEIQSMLGHRLAPVPHSDAALLLEAQAADAQLARDGLLIDHFDKARTELTVHSETSTNDFSHDGFSLLVKGWMGSLLVVLVIFVVHTSLSVP